ncbi:MAG TPA: YihY/virulence factor BrkB family protein, partial [Gemmatirosa sp.]
PIAGVIVATTAFVLFKVLPDAKQRNAHVVIAAVVTTVLWLLVTLAFRIYVQRFGDYNKTYGTIGGAIVLLTWMYLSSLVLLSGGELAAELMHGTGATRSRAGHLYGDRISTGGKADVASVG